MPDVLAIIAPDSRFVLSAWTQDLSSAYGQLKRTLARYQKPLATNQLILSPGLVGATAQCLDPDSPTESLQPIPADWKLPPLFFENRQYHFEIEFLENHPEKGQVQVVHTLKEIEESFRYNPQLGFFSHVSGSRVRVLNSHRKTIPGF